MCFELDEVFRHARNQLPELRIIRDPMSPVISNASTTYEIVTQHARWLTSGFCTLILISDYTLCRPHSNKSELSQTDPRDALCHAHRVVHKGGRSVRQTGDRGTNLSTSATVDVPWRIFKPGAWDKVSEGSTLIFLEIPEFPRHDVGQELSSCWDGRPFGHNRHGPKSGKGQLWGTLGPHWVTV